MSLVTKELKAKAEVYYGGQVCKERFSLLLDEMGLPDGLLTTTFQKEEENNMIQECGFVKELGFVWLKLREKKEHRFDNILVCLDTEVTAFLEPNKIKNMRGVKARDFLVWFTLIEIYVRDPPPPQGFIITFKSLVGLSMSFPLSLFKSDGEEEEANLPKRSKLIAAIFFRRAAISLTGTFKPWLDGDFFTGGDSFCEGGKSEGGKEDHARRGRKRLQRRESGPSGEESERKINFGSTGMELEDRPTGMEEIIEARGDN